ncbi:hypothetical protein [Actinoalloteichus hymeniacidonis]|nr:hypothetical protein [Actinoalloteichus hymeniacidonis]MBB5905923.1 hypothetical protein [Actinoalloteichus hymeniacidonis]
MGDTGRGGETGQCGQPVANTSSITGFAADTPEIALVNAGDTSG